jgi:sulfate transport system ATP-binding protein
VLTHDGDVTSRPARDRNVGFVFQHYALFRHLSVFENVAFALRVRGHKNGEVRARVSELLQLVRLDGLEGRYPSQLSGGQQQRVALARALAARPRVLLLDEPFGALDARVRQELRQWLRRLHDELHVTSVFVTHDQEEAFEVADRVILMRAGRVEQEGTPREVFEQPASAFVMGFLGHVNVFRGRIQDGVAVLGGLAVDCPMAAVGSGEVKIYVRPHELEVAHARDGGPGLRARVVHVNPLGSVTRVQLSVDALGAEVSVDLSPDRSAELGLERGDSVYVAPRRARVFAPEYSI